MTQRFARWVMSASVKMPMRSDMGETKSGLWIGTAARPVPSETASNLHFCFTAPTREAVDAFHVAALSTGGADNGAPGLRPDYGADYYAAFVVDIDGYRIEAYCGG
jgi:hypothetical protein